MSGHLDIRASDGTDFYQQVAVFAYGSYLKQGLGAVVVRQEAFRVHSGKVDAQAAYLPYSDDVPMANEMVEQINEYDPELQTVLAIVSDKGTATVITISGKELGSTPKKLYQEAVVAQQHVPIVPGTVVRLKEEIGDIEPGHFVFIGEARNEMVIASAEEDEDGDIVAGEEVHRVHVDFVELFQNTNISVDLQE